MTISPFHQLPHLQILFVSIVVGEITIILPTATLGFLEFIDLGAVYYFSMIISFALPSAAAILYFRKMVLRKNMMYALMSKSNGNFSPHMGAVSALPDAKQREHLGTIWLLLGWKSLRSWICKPELIFAIALFAFYSYLVLILPVELSYDTANYFLPYSKGLLANGHIPSDPFDAYVTLGGQPSFPPGLSAIYAYSLSTVPLIDSFKLYPIVFLLQLTVGIALISKEIFPKMPLSWSLIILLVSSPIFFVLTTAAYNPDLLFSAFFIASIFFVIKAKKSQNIIWSLMIGLGLTGMILTKDAGLFFLLPIFSLMLLGYRNLGKIWLFPLGLQLAMPAMFLLNSELRSYYLEHSLGLIAIQVASLIVLFKASRRLRSEQNIRLLPLGISLIPLVMFLILSINVWGSPIMRTYAGFFLQPKENIDYEWAADVALRNLGVRAFPIQPQNFTDLLLSTGYVFFAPALGALLFVPKIAGIFRILKIGGNLMYLLIIFVIIMANWIIVFGGFSYDIQSTFRRSLDVVGIASILAALGGFTILSIGGTRNTRLYFLFVAAIILAFNIVFYFPYDFSRFSLSERILRDDPFVQNAFFSALLFGAFLGLLKFRSKLARRIKPNIMAIAITLIFVISIIPYGNTIQTVTANDGSYEATTRYNLSTLGFGRTAIAVQDYFNERNPEGRILAYGVDWLSYRSGYQVLEMRAIINLAILKDYLTGNNAEDVVNKLKEIDVEYIVIPVSGDSADRFHSLYSETRLAEILAGNHVVEDARYGNFAIYRWR